MVTKAESHRGDEHDRRQEVIPDYALIMMEKIVLDKKDWIFRKDISKKLVNKEPALAKHLINNEVPFNKLYKQSILETIKKSMPMKEKRRLLKKAEVSAEGLVFYNFGKISGMRRRIEKKAGKVVFASSSHSGIKHLKGATLPDVAKSMYDILKYNAGRAASFHASAEIFNKKCDDKALVKRINLYAKLAMDREKLPVLRDDVKVYSGTI